MVDWRNWAPYLHKLVLLPTLPFFIRLSNFWADAECTFNSQTSKQGSNDPSPLPPLIGFSDLKLEVLKQSEWNFQYL